MPNKFKIFSISIKALFFNGINRSSDFYYNVFLKRQILKHINKYVWFLMFLIYTNTIYTLIQKEHEKNSSSNNNKQQQTYAQKHHLSHHVKSDKNKKQHLRISIYTSLYSARLINTVVELSISSCIYTSHSRLHKS